MYMTGETVAMNFCLMSLGTTRARTDGQWSLSCFLSEIKRQVSHADLATGRRRYHNLMMFSSGEKNRLSTASSKIAFVAFHYSLYE